MMSAAVVTKGTGYTPNPVRDPEFSLRLNQAADEHPHCPPLHRGRLTWTQEQMGKHGHDLSLETVRRWFNGETKPRQDKAQILSTIFDVDFGWLQYGENRHIDVRERRVRNAMADGAVNILAGMIEMDGGHPAFPDPDDQEARRANIDLHAVIKGAKYDIHVARGEEVDGLLTFAVPSVHDRIILLGLVRNEMVFEVFEISEETVEQYGRRHGGAIEVKAPRSDLRLIENFRNRL